MAAARSLAEAVRESIRELPEVHEGLGASVGVASYPADAVDGNGLIAAADAALYRVKETGRGAVQRWERSSA